MKFLIVFGFLILAACTVRAELTKEEAVAIATGCKEEAGASDADFEAMVKHQPAETTEGKCMRACTLKKFGVMSEEGKMLKDEAIELSKALIKDEEKKELVVGVIEACEGIEVSDDHCEAAEEYGHCLKTEFESKGIASAEDLVA
ncbi:general odorant-binding protein 19d-like [Lucilia sericata]|uniref:general odorant-binding protein 19d-like n=1 Tax=Lucilia sericata TaxID=13632 RepID=UPI0018A81AD0|nr:general odorant-binding protein 19d-like [Lucilia sericata]